MTREDAILTINSYEGVEVLDSRAILIHDIYDEFEMFMEKFANQITRDIHDCKDHNIKRDVHKTMYAFMQSLGGKNV